MSRIIVGPLYFIVKYKIVVDNLCGRAKLWENNGRVKCIEDIWYLNGLLTIIQNRLIVLLIALMILIRPNNYPNH